MCNTVFPWYENLSAKKCAELEEMPFGLKASPNAQSEIGGEVTPKQHIISIIKLRKPFGFTKFWKVVHFLNSGFSNLISQKNNTVMQALNEMNDERHNIIVNV